MGVGFPDIGVMDESGNSSDNGEPDDAEFNGPALIADARGSAPSSVHSHRRTLSKGGSTTSIASKGGAASTTSKGGATITPCNTAPRHPGTQHQKPTPAHT